MVFEPNLSNLSRDDGLGGSNWFRNWLIGYPFLIKGCTKPSLLMFVLSKEIIFQQRGTSSKSMSCQIPNGNMSNIKYRMICQLIDQERPTSAFSGVLGWKPINLITFLIKMFGMNLNTRSHDSTIIFTFQKFK